ncbi:MAG TPA: aminotransferase class III-fold pyridoxal phosphate-dependent enzyme [Tepidisphaeraceae bacterium]|nr:aminotransferase class III-fold pyridoxal phosphate-dependent enzyme [Tepidisphaeraceae bacterium]
MPRPTSAEMLAELAHYVIAEPYPFALDLENCQGMWLVTVEGRRVFDWAGYYGSKLIAHNHPGLSEPDYVRQLVIAANNKVANPDFLTPQCLDYYRLLYEIAPRCMKNPRLELYAVNSGAEAVENMMKYLINLHHQRMAGRITKGAGRFIYFDQAFHGRTIYALNVTQLSNDPIVTKDFQGIITGNIKVPFPFVDHSRSEAENRRRMDETLASVAWFLEQMSPEIAGIIVEPIQGAGGHRMAYPEFFRGLSELAHRHDVFLGFDEVQTAGGQTGAVFAVDQFDLPHPPQAVAAAKKLGNGVVYMLNPMEDRGVLDSTWGGNLADMVRFVQEWRIVRREGLIEQVPRKTERLVAGLNSLAAALPEVVFNVRGMGLYQGFSLRAPVTKAAVVDAALEKEDLLLLGAGTNSIRLRPSLSVTDQDIDLLVEKLTRVLREIAK